MKRKSLFTIVVLVLMITLCFQSISAVSTECNSYIKITEPDKNDITLCYKLAEKTATQYYDAKFKLENTDLSNVFVFESLSDYVSKTLELTRTILNIKSEKTAKEDFIVTYFNATCSMQDYEFREDGLFIKLSIDAEMQYPGIDGRSYFGGEVDFLFVRYNDEIRIADILFSDDDMFIESESSELSVSKWDASANAKSVRAISSSLDIAINNSNIMYRNIDVFLEDIQTIAEKENSELLNLKIDIISEKEQENTTKAYSAINGMTMAAYAKKTAAVNYRKNGRLFYDSACTNSARGSTEAPYYYEFSSITNAYDCTNFASHVLLAGGAKMKKTGNADTGWYFISEGAPGANTRSVTWAGVQKFGDFLLSNNGSGPRGSLAPRVDEEYIGYGDIIQLKRSGNSVYGHSMIRTNYYSSAYGYTGLVVSYRSGTAGGTVDKPYYLTLTNVVSVRGINILGNY